MGPALTTQLIDRLPADASLWDLYGAVDDSARAALVGTTFAAVVLSAEGIVGHSLRTSDPSELTSALANAA